MFVNVDSDSVQEALACVLIVDGEEACRVGFLPRFCLPLRDQFVDKFAQVCELYNSSDSRQKKLKSHRNCGMASCAILEYIPSLK